MSRRGWKRVTATLRDPGGLSTAGLACLAAATTLAALLFVGLSAGFTWGAAAGAVAGFTSTGLLALAVARMVEAGAEAAPPGPGRR